MKHMMRATQRFLWSWIFPSIREDVTEDNYRVSGLGRAAILTVLSLLTFVSFGIGDEILGFRSDLHAGGHSANLPLLFLNIFISLWVAYGQHPLGRLRRLTMGCLVIDVWTTLFLAWMMGSVSGYVTGFTFFIVIAYRALFDRKIGLMALGLLCGGHIVLVALELLGFIESQPLVWPIKDSVYLYPLRHMGTTIITVFFLMLAFVVVDWISLKMRGGQVALNLMHAKWMGAQTGDADPYVGVVLDGTYEIEHKLASGSMGSVYRAKQTRTGKRVAVKFLHQQLIRDEVILERFKREAEITAALGSTNIVDLYDVRVYDGHPYMVMEYLDGEDLQMRVDRRGDLSLEEVAGIIEEVSWGLERAHAEGIVHRDLKPENIFIARTEHGTDTTKILDFGVSKILSDVSEITLELSLVGTPAYMSPEQTEHSGNVDEQTDVFALAGIAYFSLTGQGPFKGDTIAQTLYNICHRQPEDLRAYRPDISSSVMDVLTIGLAKHKGKRYQSAQEFAQAFKRAMMGDVDESVAKRAYEVRMMKPIIPV